MVSGCLLPHASIKIANAAVEQHAGRWSMWPQPGPIHRPQSCPLSATLFGIFIDGLHHHLQTTVPAAEVQIRHLRLTDLVYADDNCLVASSRTPPNPR